MPASATCFTSIQETCSFFQQKICINYRLYLSVCHCKYSETDHANLLYSEFSLILTLSLFYAWLPILSLPTFLEVPSRTQPGRITDYDPTPANTGGTPYSMRNSQARVVYDSSIGKGEWVPSMYPQTAIAARKLLCGKIKIKLLGVGMIETFTSLCWMI